MKTALFGRGRNMATNIWTGSVSTDWNNAGNWSLGVVPASGDDVVIGTTANSPTLNTTTTVNAVTISGSDFVRLAGVASVLTVSNGVTLGAGGGFDGAGVLNASVTVTSTAYISSTGGTLEVAGQITDSNNQLAMSVFGPGDTLLLDAQGSTAETVSFVGGGTLELKSATLTVGTGQVNPMAIGAGTLQLTSSGAMLADSSGVTLSTGSITGAGKLAAAVAAGGTLEISGPITDSGGGLVLNIAGAADALLLDAASTAHSVTFGSSGTLE